MRILFYICAVMAATWLFQVNSACFGQNQRTQTPLTIERAVAEAIEHNLPLLAERTNIQIANARLLTARLRPNPVVSASGDHLDLLGTGFNEINAAGPAEFSLRTDFTLERRGKRQARIEWAQKSISVAELSFLDSLRLTVLAVRNAFVDVLAARDNLALARENLKTFEQIVSINEARLKAGDLAEVELARSRVAATSHANAVLRAELELSKAQSSLAALLGRPPGMELGPVEGEIEKRRPETSLEKLIERALDERPDLRALKMEQAQAAAETKLQMLEARPDYSLGTEYRRQQGINGKGNSLGFFWSASLPVFNRNQGEIARARLQEKQIEIRRRALELEIRVEVEQAYKSLDSAQTRLQTMERDLLAQARAARDITEYSYRRGEATLVELLDAQRAFNEAMQSYNETRAEYARSLYQLEAVCGKAATQ